MTTSSNDMDDVYMNDYEIQYEGHAIAMLE